MRVRDCIKIQCKEGVAPNLSTHCEESSIPSEARWLLPHWNLQDGTTLVFQPGWVQRLLFSYDVTVGS